MKPESKIALMIIVLLICISSIVVAETHPPDSLIHPLETAEQALTHALSFTGFSKDCYKHPADSLANVKKVIITDDYTPLIRHSLNDKEVWQVTFDSVFLGLPDARIYPSAIANQIQKTWDIYLDPETGRFLKAVTRYDGSDPNLSDEPSPEFSEKGMSSWSENLLISDPPPVSISNALEIASFSQPISAKQIIITLVMMEYRDLSLRPVWRIIGRGIPPVRSAEKYGRKFPLWTRNRMTSLVEAIDGLYLNAASCNAGLKPPSENKK